MRMWQQNSIFNEELHLSTRFHCRLTMIDQKRFDGTTIEVTGFRQPPKSEGIAISVRVN